MAALTTKGEHLWGWARAEGRGGGRLQKRRHLSSILDELGFTRCDKEGRDSRQERKEKYVLLPCEIVLNCLGYNDRYKEMK